MPPQIPSVVIAKMEGTENEHPLVTSKSFPAIMLFPAGEAKKAALNYESGDRNIKVGLRLVSCPGGLQGRGSTAGMSITGNTA